MEFTKEKVPAANFDRKSSDPVLLKASGTRGIMKAMTTENRIFI